jgi:hypothetical protein
MSQDASKVILASSLSSVKDVEAFNADPASFPAGLCVRLASTGDLSLAKSAGMLVGVSKGKSLSDHKKTDVLRTGLKVPVRAALLRAQGEITVTNFAHLTDAGADTVTIGATVFTAQTDAATPGAGTFQAASSNNATATSLATQINAHTTAGDLVFAVASAAVVTLYAKAEGTSGNDVTVIYTNTANGTGITLDGITDDKLTGGSDDPSDIDYITVGTKMYINDETGMADLALSGFSTISDAIYISSYKTGIMEDNSQVGAVLVDMAGGL